MGLFKKRVPEDYDLIFSNYQESEKLLNSLLKSKVSLTIKSYLLEAKQIIDQLKIYDMNSKSYFYNNLERYKYIKLIKNTTSIIFLINDIISKKEDVDYYKKKVKKESAYTKQNYNEAQKVLDEDYNKFKKLMGEVKNYKKDIYSILFYGEINNLDELIDLVYDPRKENEADLMHLLYKIKNYIAFIESFNFNGPEFKEKFYISKDVAPNFSSNIYDLSDNFDLIYDLIRKIKTQIEDYISGDDSLCELNKSVLQLDNYFVKFINSELPLLNRNMIPYYIINNFLSIIIDCLTIEYKKELIKGFSNISNSMYDKIIKTKEYCVQNNHSKDALILKNVLESLDVLNQKNNLLLEIIDNNISLNLDFGSFNLIEKQTGNKTFNNDDYILLFSICRVYSLISKKYIIIDSTHDVDQKIIDLFDKEIKDILSLIEINL